MATGSISRRTLIVLAVAAGIGAANLYYSQPLLSDMSAGLHASRSSIGLVPVLTQAGYACGLLLVVPLSDVIDPRRLMSWMALGTAVVLTAVAVAPSVQWLLAASFLVGCATVIPQLAIPTAARLSSPAQRGPSVGTVMGGLLIGVILSRAYSGLVGSLVSWRGVFWIAACVMVISSGTLRALLPPQGATGPVHYRAVLRSLPGVMRRDAALSRATVVSGLVFGGLSCFWAAVIFYVEKPPYAAGPRMVGLLALVGVCGAVAAPRIGRAAGNRSGLLIGGAIASCLIAFVILGALGSMLAALVAGTLLLDGGCQVNEVANLVRVFSGRDSEQGRANTVFMVGLFAGGSVGSGLADWSWATAGWMGVCIAGASMCVLALGFHILPAGRRRGSLSLRPGWAREADERPK